MTIRFRGRRRVADEDRLLTINAARSGSTWIKPVSKNQAMTAIELESPRPMGTASEVEESISNTKHANSPYEKPVVSHTSTVSLRLGKGQSKFAPQGLTVDEYVARRDERDFPQDECMLQQCLDRKTLIMYEKAGFLFQQAQYRPVS
jgi:hypothetical protein